MDEIELYSLKSLMIFKTLIETGTATKTAKVLGITQSGVSRSLSQLEQNLGLLLFIRQKNRLIATPEAQELHGEIMRLVGNIDELRHSVMALREFGASRIGIAAVPGLGFGFVPSLVGKMLEANRRLSIYLDIMSSHDVIHAVEAGMFDIGFATLPVVSNQLITEKLIETEAVCLLPKNHPLCQYQSIHINQLDGQQVVVPNQPNLGADQLLGLIASNGVRIAGKTEANIASICSLVGNGVGVSIINPITAHDLAHHNMVVRPFAPTMLYSFGIFYQEKWRDNNIIKQIHANLPSITEYLQ